MRIVVTAAQGEHVGEALVRGQRVDGRAGRVRHRQAGRDRGELLDRAPHVLCVTAGQAGIPVDRRALVEARAGAGVTLDNPGELAAGDIGQRAGPAAAAQLSVPGTNARREDPDENVVRAG